MADYKVSLGAEVRTGEIDKQLKNYNGSVNIKVNPDSITSGIDSALRGYSAAPIEVKSTLNTQGITDKLKSFSEKGNRTKIKVDVDPQLTGVGTTLENYFTSSNAKALRVKVDINWAGVKGQIQTPSEDIGKLQLDAELNKSAIGNAIKSFNKEINAAESKIKIKVKVDPDLKSINTKLKNYQSNIKPLKIMPDLKKSEIDKQISGYNNRKNKRNIQLKAKLADGTIDEAITKYVSKEMVPVTVRFTVGSTESIDKKITSYKTNGVDVPVRLIPAQKDFTAKVKNTPVNVTAQIDPVEIQKDVEAAVGGYTPTAKMPINIRLTQPKDINEQVRALTKPTETIDVNAKLNTQSLNDDIGIFQPTAVLGVNSHLIMSDIDDQIAAYTPSVPVKVNVLFNDGNVDEKTGLQKMQDPIHVNVHLNNEDINKQIDGFKPTSKVKVGVQLDFATHKDKDTKEVLQKGVVQQIKEYETATKVKVGVELDKESVDATVQNFKTDVPIKLDVDLNTEPAEKRIEELKAEFKKFGNININFVGADNNGTTSEAAAIASAGVGSSAGNASGVAQQFREVDITVKNTTDAVKNLNSALSKVGFDSGSIDVITKDLKELDISVKNVTSRLNEDGTITLTVKGVDKFERAVKMISNVNKNGTSNSVTISQDFKETENAFKSLKKMGAEISKLDIKIAGLDARKDSAEIDKLTEKLNRLEAEYNELFNLAEGKLTGSQIDELARDIADGSEKLDILKAKLKDARTEAANQIRIKFNDGDFNVLSRLNSEVNKLSGTYPELEANVREVGNAIRDMESAIGTGDEIADVENLISAYERYKHAIKGANNLLGEAQRFEQDSAAQQKLMDDRALLQSRIDAWLTKNSAAAKKFGERLREIKIEAQSADRVKLDSLQSEFKQIDKDAEAAGLRMQTVGDRLKTQFQKYQSYFSVATLFMYAGQALRSMFEQVKSIDSAMTELKKVTSETDSAYNQFLTKAASRSKELGTTIDGLISSTAEFAKLGYSFEESQGLAEVANIYAVVGDEIESVEDATQSLVSTLAAFKHEIGDMSNDEFAMSIVDKFNEVANKYSISSGGLGEALQRSASSMAAANNTLDETIAMITAANEVAQNPEKVGNAMKTMSMRIRGAKTELEEAGESTDGMAESTASLRAEMLALSGVDIMLNENTFKSTYQIMDELSKKWGDLSDIAQATIIELVAGKHQGNVFSSLMANFDTARAALDTSLNSSGSAMAEHAKWSQSLEARLNKLKAAWQSLSQAFLSSDFLKVALDFVIGLADGIGKLIDAVGVLPSFIAAFTLFQSFRGKGFFSTIVDEATGAATGITNVFTNAFNKITTLITAFRGQSQGAFTFGDGFYTSLDNDTTALQAYQQALDAGMSKQTAFNATMQNASPAAQQFAQTMEVTNSSILEFENNQKMSQLSLQAQNKSLVNCGSLISSYNNSMQTCGLSQKEFLQSIQKSNPALYQYLSGLNGAEGSIKGYIASLAGAKLGTIGLQVATMALNAALTMGIGLIMSGLFSAIQKWINAEKELAEQVDDVTSKFKEQQNELVKGKSSFESEVNRYAKLSKGVDQLGRNISLTADEYSEYQKITNSVANKIPSLIAGYDSQGNAILNVKGNVDELIAAYEKLIEIENNKVLSKSGDIQKDFENSLEKYNTPTQDKLTYEAANIYKEILNSKDIDKAFGKIGKNLYENIGLDNYDYAAMSKALEKAGIKRNTNLFSPNAEDSKSHVMRAFKENKDVVLSILNDFYSSIEAETDGMKSIAQAALSNAFDISSSDFYGMDDTLKNVAKQAVNSFDYEFFAGLTENGISVGDYVNNMLKQLNALSESDVGSINAVFDLQTKFNGGDISYGEYVSNLRDLEKTIDGLNLDEEIKEQLKISLNLDEDGIVGQYDRLLNRLTSEEIGLSDKAAKNFLDSLSVEELSVLVDIIPQLDAGTTIDEIKSIISEKLALEFTFDIKVQTEGIEALNTALSEARSATGLTEESLAALKSRYEDLDGFNAAALFENTALGIRLNNEELARLESQYETINKLDVDKNISKLASKYKELTEKISACTDEKEKEKLRLEADGYAKKIEELSTLSSMYDGLTSSFNKWQAAMSSPNNGDNYDSIFDNFEKANELFKGGLVGTDDFKTFAQLMTNEDLSGASVDAFVSAYKNGLPVMKKYFTEGQNGCKNFLKDISKINSEWAHLNEDGKWEINFDTEDVAKELRIHEDAVLLIVEKLRDFGFEVKIKDNSLKNIQTEIEKSEAKLKELGAEPYKVDLTIEANSQNLVVIESEIDKIKTRINEINNDSTITPEVKAAQLEDLRLKLESLIQKKQEASQPAFMKLDTSQVGASLVGALEKVQAYQNAIDELNKLSELKEAGIVVDDSEVISAQQKVDECAKAIQGLNEDVKVAIGLDENASIDQIKKAFEDGKINIDANTDPATTKIERLAKEVDKIEDKDVTINVTVKGLDEVKELNRNIDLATNIDGDIDSLTKYVDSAKALKELGGNVTSYVTANISGNVIDTKEKDLEKIEIFADSADGLKGVGSFTSNVDANIEGNVLNIVDSQIGRLKTYSDSAKDVASIGVVSSKVTANIEGDVIDTAEHKINNLKTYSDSAKDIRSIGNVESSVTANVSGNVLNTVESQIDNLKVYSDSAKDIGSVGNVESSVTANVSGNVITTGESQIDNLKVYSDSAKDISSIGKVDSSVTANVSGNVLTESKDNIAKLKVYSDSAKDISSIGKVDSSVTANVSGNVLNTVESQIDNLKVYSDSAKDISSIGKVDSSVTANVSGNVITTGEGKINNLKTYYESAKDIGKIGTIESSVTANVSGNVLNTVESQIDNLKVYSDSAKDIGKIGEVESKVTADISGNVITTGEGKINNLKTYSDSAKDINKIGDVESSVVANVSGNVLNTVESQIDNLGVYGENASKVKDVGSFSSYVTANVNGNIITDETVVSDLEHFASVVNGMQGQTVAVNVTANVDSANINQAIDLLTNLSTSGVFKDYSATVQVGANIATIDDTAVQSYEAPDKDGKVIYEVDSSDVDAWVAPDKTGTVNYSAEVEALTYGQLHKTGTITYVAKVTGTAGASGTAHAGGTASGRAFARGDWGIKGNGVALGGELGRELVVRDGKFFTIGDEGAEFFRYKKNDIVFNASQTESLFKYGGIKGANPRGKMLASGSAFVEGNAFGGSSVTGGGQFYGYISGGSSGSSGSSNSSSEKIEKSDDKDFYDWIEILINRIERAIDYFEKKANNVFDSWENRGDALNKQTDLIRQEIEKQQEAYDYYLQFANSLVISNDSKKDAEYKERIQNGTIKISQYTGDDREKLENYKQFYDKALDCKDAIEELKEAESELYKQRLDNVITRYEGILGVIEHEKNMLEEYINQSEAQAWLVSREYYNALADNERENVAELEAQKAEMLNAFNEAMDSGTIVEGSEAYYEMVASIDEVTLAITESHTTLLEYEQTLQQLSWEAFDLLKDKISSITEETEFLIELLSSDKLFDDNGQLTDAGMATMGQHGVAYNAYMHQADLAAVEAARLKAELEKDPYDTELEERYREMISLQQEHILSAQGEKEAIRDLVEEGIGLELEALQELIDKKNEALESERDLYEYQKKVKEQTEEIASLEKQMAAYSGDDSEEAKQKIQKIKVDLESARQDLEEAEYDKFIDDSSAMLDELYLDYETILNTRLDNIDALLEDMIEEINLNAVDISNTLSEKADSVGYTLSDSMTEIWDKNSVSTQNVITTYSEKFITAQTTTNNALDSINIKLQDMINKLNKKATSNVKSASTSSVAKSTTTKSTTTATTTKKSTSGGDGTPKIGDKVKFVNGQYYYDSYGMRPLGSQKQGQYVYITNINNKSGATHPYHISTGTKLGSGDLGWLKLSQISGYATGKKNFSNDEIAWTQEGATEFIVRPSDGAILTPIAKRDSVLTSAASRNIWDMANSPAEFIKNNLNFGSAGVPNSSNIQNNYTQHLEKVVISFPNVKNYDEVLSALRDDKSFEKLVHSMTIDRIAGKSSLAKGKSIR